MLCGWQCHVTIQAANLPILQLHVLDLLMFLPVLGVPTFERLRRQQHGTIRDGSHASLWKLALCCNHCP
jgi:hypothetical protein